MRDAGFLNDHTRQITQLNLREFNDISIEFHAK